MRASHANEKTPPKASAQLASVASLCVNSTVRTCSSNTAAHARLHSRLSCQVRDSVAQYAAAELFEWWDDPVIHEVAIDNFKHTVTFRAHLRRSIITHQTLGQLDA